MEKAASQISRVNPKIRLITARFGLVLAEDALAWKKMVTPIRLGFGGPIGSGQQWFSWIDADDIAAAFFYLYHLKGASGVYNFTSPEPIRQKELAAEIAQFYHKPHFLRVPAFLIRLLMGKAGDELVLASCKALPEKLINTGFRFAYSNIHREIRHIEELNTSGTS